MSLYFGVHSITTINTRVYLSIKADLHVTLMGIGAFLGGMMTLTPEWRQPRMAPPRASTMKLTRNLETRDISEQHGGAPDSGVSREGLLVK